MTTAVLVIDEDWSKADPVALAATGYRAVVGYVSEDTTGKNLTRADVDAAHRAGLAVGIVYEYATEAALGGAARGTRDAGIAISHARGLGTPGGVALYHAVDFQPAPADLPTILAYALAGQRVCAAAGYWHGIYASYAVCRYLAEHGYTGFLWQTYAWSAGQWWPGAVLRQTQNGIHVAGATVDRDEAEALDWGQWQSQLGRSIEVSGTDNIIYAWSQGNPTGPGGEDVEPVKWRIRDEQWQASVTQALTALAGLPKQLDALTTVLQAVTSGGSSIDTSAVLAAVKAVGDVESAAVSALTAQLAAAQAELHQLRTADAAAAQAEVTVLAPPAQQ